MDIEAFKDHFLFWGVEGDVPEDMVLLIAVVDLDVWGELADEEDLVDAGAGLGELQ